jgi:hypothetical protein
MMKMMEEGERMMMRSQRSMNRMMMRMMLPYTWAQTYS